MLIPAGGGSAGSTLNQRDKGGGTLKLVRSWRISATPYKNKNNNQSVPGECMGQPTKIIIK